MSDDPHAPTNAGPDPAEGAAAEGSEAWVPPAAQPEGAAAAPAPEPTPVVPPSEASWRTPPGSAAATGPAPSDRPEVEVGLAFAGGVAAALLLKVLTR